MKYINNLLQRYRIKNYSLTSTYIIETKLNKAPDGYICKLQTLKDYLIHLEEIMHLMVKICFDRTYFVF